MGCIAYEKNPPLGDLLPFIVKGRDGMTQNFPDPSLFDEIQALNESVEVLTGLHHLPLFKNPANTNRKPLSLWKDPTIAIRDSTEIKMQHLEIFLLKSNG